MTIDCTHFEKCSGCDYESIHKPPEIFLKAKKFFRNEHGLDLELVQGAARYWRSRAKLAVRKDPKNPLMPLIGLFEKNAHTVLPIPFCQVHHPAINEAVNRVKKELIESGATYYDEVTHEGDLRYIQCIVERRSGRVQLVLVVQKKSAFWDSFCQNLYNSDLWHSIWMNYNDKKTNTIFGPEWEKAIGLDSVWEVLNHIETPVGPMHFSQANLEMYEILLEDLYDALLKKHTVVELYAGTGTISMQIAKKCTFLRLLEIQESAKPLFEKALSHLPIAVQKKISYYTAASEESKALFKDVNTCIVDPPRKGLGKKVIDTIFSNSTLSYLIYISCNFNTLQDDLLYIEKHYPDWVVIDAISYLFFPGTNHIECMIFLEKESG